MGWYCVHIENIRACEGGNATFRKMLIDDYRFIGQPPNCRVYLDSAVSGYFCYFSPAAAKALEAFIDFWEGFGIPAPNDLHKMEVVL